MQQMLYLKVNPGGAPDSRGDSDRIADKRWGIRHSKERQVVGDGAEGRTEADFTALE
jgi:hypothetical protein